MNIKNEVYHNQEIRNNDEIFGRKQNFSTLSNIWQIRKLKRKSLKLTLKGKHRLDSRLENKYLENILKEKIEQSPKRKQQTDKRRWEKIWQI